MRPYGLAMRAGQNHAVEAVRTSCAREASQVWASARVGTRAMPDRSTCRCWATGPKKVIAQVNAIRRATAYHLANGALQVKDV